MGKYLDLEQNIFSVFSSEAWKSEGIKTFPTNYIAVNAGNEFIKVNILPGDFGINIASLSGVVIIDIFTPVGKGPRRISVIADLLDTYLVGKSFSINAISTNVQFLGSSLSYTGVDYDNPSLYKAEYTITFNYFGVQ